MSDTESKDTYEQIKESIGRLYELTSEERNTFVEGMREALGLSPWEPDNPTWCFWSALRSYCRILNEPWYRGVIEKTAFQLTYAIWDLPPEKAQQLLEAPKSDLPIPVARALDDLICTHPDLPEEGEIS